MYININTNQYPITETEIRMANPNTSFPAAFSPTAEYALVFPYPVPLHDPVIQTVREIAPVLTSKGHWEQRWEVVPRFSEYTDANGVTHTVAEQEAAALAEKLKLIQDSIVEQTQNRLDAFARTRNYDGILSAATYATSTVPKFQAEGQYAVEARDSTWAKLYEILAEVEAGTRPAPTGYADVEPELPILTWPE